MLCVNLGTVDGLLLWHGPYPNPLWPSPCTFPAQIRCWKNAFWFVTLLYPRCAMTALQLFGLQKVDEGWYLSVDFSIMVSNT